VLGFLRGNTGELRAGYQCAAKLGPWTARKNSAGYFVVEGEALEVDSYWIAHRPLELRLFMGKSPARWTWTNVDVQSNGNKLLLIVTNSKPEK